MRATLTAMLVAAMVLSGCGEQESDAKAVAGSFLAALESGDAGRACSVLSASTRESLQRDEQARCPRALLRLGLSGGRVTAAQVYVSQARVTVANGESVFLGLTPAGWKIDAAGCRPAGEREPFDCELES